MKEAVGGMAVRGLALAFLLGLGVGAACPPLAFAQGTVPVAQAEAPVALSPRATTEPDFISFEQFKAHYTPSERALFDRHGQVLVMARSTPQYRRLPWVSLDEISPALIEALLVAEDKRFFEHGGVDWLAVASALWQQAKPFGKSGAVRGASSLSMQVAAMMQADLQRKGGPRSLTQKFDQIRAALALEEQWTKLQILEAYLNSVSYRGELQGIGAASWGLFAKAPSGLDKAESAVLAALIRAPNAAPAQVSRRACQILQITRASQDCDAEALVIRVQEAKLAPQPYVNLAPHAAYTLLAAGQGDVHSSLDASLQRKVSQALREQVSQLSQQGGEDGAAVVLDNASGEVLAYVGSSGRLSRAAQVDAALAPRQAGSTLKPFLVAQALDRHLLNASTLLDDSPLAVGTDGGVYAPHNYDERFVGPVSVRKALASSLNVPAVRTLMLVGVDQFHGVLGQLGFSSLHPKAQHYGYSLALGSADVRLLDLTNAYRTLANAGGRSPVVWQVGGAPGKTSRVFSPVSAAIVGSILSDNLARSHTFGFDSVLATPFWTAVKTGTSKDMRDNWCIGYSERYTVGVWVGNASGTPMRDVSGVSGAAPAWADIMRYLHRTVPSQAPPRPPGLVLRRTEFENELEPTRLEWYSAAMLTQAERDASQATVRIQLTRAAGSPRIVLPQNGDLLAWDPDIPPAVQAVSPRHSTPERTLRWVLNGVPLPSTAPRFSLQAGRNHLVLMDEAGVVLDKVQFEVRGMPKGKAPAPAAALVDLPS